jgi:hypothetical protein
VEPLRYSDAEVVEYENMKKDPSAVVWIPINAKWTLKKVETWKLKSVYEEMDENDVKTYWHVHPELVEKVGKGRTCSSILVCPHCSVGLGRGLHPFT